MALTDFAPRLTIPHPFDVVMGGAQVWAASIRAKDDGPAKSAKIITMDGWTIRIAKTSKRDLACLARREVERRTEAVDDYEY